MKFGPVAASESKGAILAHSVQLPGGKRLRKGIVLDELAINSIVDSGITEIIVAQLEPGEIHENEASTTIASWLVNSNVRGEEAFTGRVNLYSNHNGVFDVDVPAIDAFNAVDPAITIATLKKQTQVLEGTMVATIKIIPYGAKSSSMDAVRRVCSGSNLTVHPYRKKRVGLISTTLPTLTEKILKKTERILQQRLLPSRSEIVESKTVNHKAGSVKSAILEMADRCDLIVIFGASAISDEQDVIPAGFKQARGKIIRLGMPVDPGNLLMLGKLNTVDVIGAPGCARSPAENGFDWVLQRLLADVPVSGEMISSMGVGGLLKEISSRPQPRQINPEKSQANIAGIVLAAGQSRRMGVHNKLRAKIEGKSLVRIVVDAALESFPSSSLFVVTGHQSELVEAELSGSEIILTHNPHFADGLSTSLATGIRKLPNSIDAALILLGDMPRISGENIQELIRKFEASKPGSIIVSTHGGKRGNPVLWPRLYFEALTSIRGDVGARHILGENEENIVEVELGPAASFDIDTPAALASAYGIQAD